MATSGRAAYLYCCSSSTHLASVHNLGERPKVCSALGLKDCGTLRIKMSKCTSHASQVPIAHDIVAHGHDFDLVADG